MTDATKSNIKQLNDDGFRVLSLNELNNNKDTIYYEFVKMPNTYPTHPDNNKTTPTYLGRFKGLVSRAGCCRNDFYYVYSFDKMNIFTDSLSNDEIKLFLLREIEEENIQ
jgi:hypothetical protein